MSAPPGDCQPPCPAAQHLAPGVSLRPRRPGGDRGGAVGRPSGVPGCGGPARTPRRRPLSCFRPVFVVREEAAPRSVGPSRLARGVTCPQSAGASWGRGRLAGPGRQRVARPPAAPPGAAPFLSALPPHPLSAAAGERVGVLSQPLYSRQ